MFKKHIYQKKRTFSAQLNIFFGMRYLTLSDWIFISINRTLQQFYQHHAWVFTLFISLHTNQYFYFNAFEMCVHIHTHTPNINVRMKYNQMKKNFSFSSTMEFYRNLFKIDSVTHKAIWSQSISQSVSRANLYFTHSRMHTHTFVFLCA